MPVDEQELKVGFPVSPIGRLGALREGFGGGI